MDVRRMLVWDLPTRAFHWLLAGGFVAAAAIAFLADDEGALFPYHALIGLTLALLVVFRVVWGLLGTRYARFGSFAFGVGSVLAYLRGVLLGGGPRFVGHNPGSAWAIFAMLAMVAGLAATGIALGQGIEAVKEVHEALAWGMVAVATLHVLGVLVHTLRHRENLTASMVHGMKDADATAGIATARPLVAVLLVVLTGAWAWGLAGSYEGATRTLRIPLVGTVVQVGETEEDEGAERPGERGRDREDEHEGTDRDG